MRSLYLNIWVFVQGVRAFLLGMVSSDLPGMITNTASKATSW
ncbi:MAG: hypothetical protein AAF334_00425 [Pseudomonadota bacterium]